MRYYVDDNGMSIIQKNDDDEYHYYGNCGQYIENIEKEIN